MDILTANETKTHFGDLLPKAQRSPVQINKNGKPVAVVLSADEYASIEQLKQQLLTARAAQAKADIAAGHLVDGEDFMDALEAGQHD